MNTRKESILPPGARWPFVLLASCFLWWAIANNLTDPLVKVFKEIFVMTTFHDLRPGVFRLGRGYQAGLVRPDHGDRGRSHHYADARRHRGQMGSQLLVLTTAALLRCDRTLRADEP